MKRHVDGRRGGFQSLRQRLLHLFVVFGLLPLAVGALGVGYFHFRYDTEIALNRLQELSQRAALEIDLALHQGEQALQRLQAYRNLMALPENAQAGLLDELIARHPYLREVALADIGGRELVHRARDRVVLKEQRRQLGGHPLFQAAVRAEGPRYAPIRHRAEDGEPLVELAVPVMDVHTGRPAGVLLADMRLRHFWQTVARLSPGDGVEVLVVDADNLLVAHANPSLVLRGTRFDSLPQRGATHDPGGRFTLLAQTPIDLGEHRLGVVAMQGWIDAMRPTLYSLSMIGGLMAAVLALVLLGGALALRRIMQPVTRVSETAHAIAAGDLGRRAPVVYNDEIGELANTFNAMTETLQRNQLLLRLVLDTLPIYVFWKDRESRYLGCNRLFAEAGGLDDPEAIVGLVDYDLSWRQYADLYRNDDAEVMREGVAKSSYEEPLMRADGRQIWIRTTKVPLRNDAGEVVGVLGEYMDVTEEKLARERLARSQIEWTRAMDFFEDAIYLLDSERRLVRANQAFYRLVHGNQDDLPGRHIVDILHPAGEREPCPVCRAQVALHDDVVVLEADHPGNPTGVPTEVATRVIRDEDGQPTGILVSIRDLSRTRLMEEHLRQAAGVFNSTQEGIVVTDADGVIETVNPAFTVITGYTEREVVGKTPRLLRSGQHDEAFYRTMWTALVAGGSWHGEVWNRRKNGEIFVSLLNINAVKDDGRRHLKYVGVFSDITAFKQSQEQLEFLAHHDPLTRLPNRLLFRSRLEHAMASALRSGGGVAILFLDLDRFKQVNDSLGHTLGDSLLQAVAERLRQGLRAEDTVARLGGDEFIVLMEHIHAPGDAAALAEKLIATLASPFEIGGHELFIGCSIGICLYPQDGDSIETLLSQADAAMYRAKEAGRNTYRFYTRKMTEDALDHLLMEGQLRRAIENDELRLYYQAQVDLADGHIVGYEALVRWQHPEQGLLMPGAFIGLAEESGLIVTLGEWVLREACRQGREWLDAGLEFGRIAVNVAAPQVHRGDLVASVRSVLEQTGLPPERLELEITESFLVERTEAVRLLLQSLRELDVSLAIDDFGTGYSSLSYLKRLPIDKLKIDRQFIMDLPDDQNDAAISRAVIALGRSLDFGTIAEGVETVAQRDFLQAEGCRLGQGYLYSRPVPAQQVPAQLQAGVLPVVEPEA